MTGSEKEVRMKSKVVLASAVGAALSMALAALAAPAPQAWPGHLTWGSILLFLLARGGGAFAADRLLGIEPRFRK